MQERIWAPWRYPYLKGEDDEVNEGCIFCNKPKESNDKDALIVYRGSLIFVIMNKYPYINGHLLIAPYRHIDDLCQCGREEHLEMMDLIIRSITVLRECIHPDAFNIGMNLGRTAGAGIEEHLHFHVVPRWNGDTNYMSVIGDTRVISMSLEEGWELFSEKFKQISNIM